MERLLHDLERVVSTSLETAGVDILELAASDAQGLQRVLRTLSDYYARKGQCYLLRNDEQEDAATRLSRKYFLAKNDRNAICGVICVDPCAHEVRGLAHQFGLDASCLKRKVEFRRFVSLDEKRSPAVSTALMATAARWALMHEYRGVLALTRSVQRRFFMRFGLASLTPAAQPLVDRGDGEYWLMSGDWPSISVAAERFLHKNQTAMTAF